MTKNNRLPKKRTQPQAVKRQEIQIEQGNVPILTVKLLNDINENLREIKEALIHGRPE